MNIQISYLSEIPIYQQIADQIKKEIINHNLLEEQLPSIRNLSRALEVSVITIKKSYEILLQEGFIYAKGGVGYFVAAIDFDKVKENYKKDFSKKLTVIIKDAKDNNISQKEVLTILTNVIGEQYEN